MEKGLTTSARTLNCRGRLLDLFNPVIMAIINITPDSFYSGSRVDNMIELLAKVETAIQDGAEIIDVGSVSTRPGSNSIKSEDEISRLKPYLNELISSFPNTLFSIDTTNVDTARYALNEGFHMINDISGGGSSKKLWKLAKEEGASYVMMHMQGSPKDMQENPVYNNVTLDILQYFIDMIQQADKIGFYNYAIDPGFGFGKTIDQNYKLLRDLDTLDILDRPILVGLSRKSMIYKPLDIGPSEALNGTTALHMIALQNGASILRVHDTKEAKQAVELHLLMRES